MVEVSGGQSRQVGNWFLTPSQQVWLNQSKRIHPITSQIIFTMLQTFHRPEGKGLCVWHTDTLIKAAKKKHLNISDLETTANKKQKVRLRQHKCLGDQSNSQSTTSVWRKEAQTRKGYRQSDQHWNCFEGNTGETHDGVK